MSRFIVEGIFDRKIRDLELAITQTSIKYTLSGPMVISGNLPVDTFDLIQLGLVSWGDLIHFEDDAGRIAATGVLMPAGIDESGGVKIEAEGPSTYPHGMLWTGDYEGVQVDPLDIVRMIWADLQSKPFGDLNVYIGGATSPVRIGEEKRDVSFDATNADTGQTTAVEFSAGPYTLNWWENTDLGSEIDRLAQETPFDYLDHSQWNADKTGIDKFLFLGYPRLGHKRYDLGFRSNENIISGIPLLEDRSMYASEVVVTGAGTGRDQIMATASSVPPAGRLRRMTALTDNSIKSVGRARAIADFQLQRRVMLQSISSIVIDGFHENAPYGSFSCGDDILVQADLPWIGKVAIWHRIVSYTYTPADGRIQLDLQRSDAFTYGYPE